MTVAMYFIDKFTAYQDKKLFSGNWGTDRYLDWDSADENNDMVASSYREKRNITDLLIAQRQLAQQVGSYL